MGVVLRGARTRAIGALLLLGAALLGTGQARAEEPTAEGIQIARRLFAEAQRDQAAGHWDDALTKLTTVVKIKETAGIHYYMAVCHEHLNHLLKARDEFETAKRLAERDQVQDVLSLVDDRLRSLAEKIPTLTVELKGAPVRSTVLWVEYKSFGAEAIGKPIEFDPGSYQITVTVNEVPWLQQSIQLTQGQVAHLEVQAPADKSTLGALGPPRTASQDSSSASSVWPWVAVGTGVALGLGGLWAYMKADSLAEDSEKVCAASVRCDSARASDVRRWDSLATGLWIGAAASLGVGLVWTVSKSSSSPAASSTVIAVQPNQVSLRTSF